MWCYDLYVVRGFLFGYEKRYGGRLSSSKAGDDSSLYSRSHQAQNTARLESYF